MSKAGRQRAARAADSQSDALPTDSSVGSQAYSDKPADQAPRVTQAQRKARKHVPKSQRKPPKARVLGRALSACASGKATYYVPAFLPVIRLLAELGAIDAQIAHALGIGLTTFNEWKRDHDDLIEALEAKEYADAQVVQSLRKRAMGFTRKLQKAFVDRDGVEHTIEVTEEVPPDTIAQIYWTKNRMPQEWRDRHEVSHEVSTSADDLRDARLRARERDQKVYDKQTDEVERRVKLRLAEELTARGLPLDMPALIALTHTDYERLAREGNTPRAPAQLESDTSPVMGIT